jgi:hypothetical protein
VGINDYPDPANRLEGCINDTFLVSALLQEQGGGIHRDGGPRVRGLTPPDDIRHRHLRRDAKEQMWRQRALKPLNERFGGSRNERPAWMGSDGATLRLGRGMRARVQRVQAAAA